MADIPNRIRMLKDGSGHLASRRGARCSVCASLVALAALACDNQQGPLGPTQPSSRIVAPPAASCPSPGLTIVDLGVLPGGTGFSVRGEARAINDKGEVVGGTDAADGHEHAFLWTQAGGMEDLGLLPGGLVSHADDINDAGEVVGYSQTGSSFAHAFLWSRTTGMRDLGTLPGGAGSQAFAINETHQVTGYSFNAAGKERPVVWSASGAIQDLGTPPGSISTFASDINESGQVAGVAYGPAGFPARAFLWTEADGFQFLGTLPGGSESGASALNDLAQVVGLAKVADGENHAFLWSANDGIRDLGTLPGSPFSLADGINNAGQVVGSDAATGFIWSEAEGMQPLPPLPGGAIVGGASASAFDINDRGQIVGTGHTAEGSFHAVLWTLGAGTPTSQVEDLIARVEDLVGSGELEQQNASPLLVKLHAAHQALLEGKPTTAVQGQLGGFINQVNALVLSRRLAGGVGEELVTAARCIASD
jgi:probable HAF family extracellular repeat protein